MIIPKLGKLNTIMDLLFFPIYKWAVGRDLFKLAGVVVSLTVFALNQKSQRRVLFLDRSIFRDDLSAMAKYSGLVQYVGIQRKYFREIVNHFFKESLVSELTYHHDPKLNLAKKQAFDAIEKVLTVLHQFVRFDGIISCNFGYPDQQEIFSVARTKEWPVIILFKEGLMPRADLLNLFNTYEKKYLNCDLLLCYNEGLASLFRTSKIPGAEKARVKAVGIPRLDSLKEVRGSPPKKQVVLFSFFPGDKTKYAGINGSESLEIDRIVEQFHRDVLRLAIENPDLAVVIKTKTAPQYPKYVKGILEKHFGRDRYCPNLRITNEGSSIDFIKHAAVVLGGQSTTLIEGLLAGRAVGCPKFPAWFEYRHGLIPSTERGISKIVTYQQLLTLVAAAIEVESFSETKNSRGLEELILTTEFDAAARAEIEIVKQVEYQT
jgi:hypothetical protein